MIAPDVNVLLYAFREDAERHVEYHAWLQKAMNGSMPVALFEPVLASVLRVATHPAIYRPPSRRADVEAFLDTCLAAPAALPIRAELRHWGLFREMRDRTNCRGNLVQDAYLAALALEHDCTYVTTDKHFAQFPRLRWQHPLDHARSKHNPA